MSSISTQVLSGDNLNDMISISVDPALTYSSAIPANTSGYFLVTIDSVSYSVTAENAAEETFSIDLSVPQFNAQNDTAIIDNLEVAITGTGSPQTDVVFEWMSGSNQGKYVFAVNQGIPSPSAFVQGDGTWDLLQCKVNVPSSTTTISSLVVTVDYDVEFVEVLATGTAAGSLVNREIALHVTHQDKPVDNVKVSLDVGTMHVGVVRFVAVDLETAISNQGDTFIDSVPEFYIGNIPTVNGWGSFQTLVRHPISKSSTHTKTYDETKYFLFAVNDNKIDGNGYNESESESTGSLETKLSLMNVSLFKNPAFPCDDMVDGTFNCKMSSLTIVA